MHYGILIACVIALSNPRWLLPIWPEKLRGHYHVTMTSDNEFCVWRWHYRKRHSRVSVNAQTITRNAPRIRALYIAQWASRLDWSKFVYRDEYKNYKKMLFSLCFCHKNTHKTHEIVKVAVIVSAIVWIRRWLFWTSVFFFGSCAPSEKYLGPKQSPPISHNDLKKDGAQ